MILTQNNSGTSWWFTDDECTDYAYICACMPSDRMSHREVDFIGKMEVKFRNGGGYLTEGQWNWFMEVAQKYSRFIQGQEHVAEDARALAARMAQGGAA